MAFGKIDVRGAEADVGKAEQRLAMCIAERGGLADRLSVEVDYDAHFALQQELGVADQKIAAAEAAKDHALARLDRARREAADAEIDRNYQAAKKAARADEKLTLEIATTAEKLADLLAAQGGYRQQIEGANARRGERAFIPDGERRIRELPAREIPADVRRETAWVNDRGEQPSQLTMRDGKLVPLMTGYGPQGPFTYREVEIVQSPARHEPARMPTRLADEIRLVNLKGEQIWPPRK